MPAVMIAPNGQAHEVSDEHIESARSEGYEPAARFTRNGQQVVVPATGFDAAFKEGLQPVDKKEMGIWDAFKTGVSAGMQPASELAAGMTGFPFVPPEQEAQTELEKSQAWEEHPIAYGLGKAIPTVGAIGAGAMAARGAQKAGGAAIAATRPMIQPSIQAGRESFKSTMANPAIPDVMGITKPIAAGASAIRGAIKQVPETRREMADLARLEQASPNPESGAINPRNQRLFLGQELLDPGMTPEKQALAERSVTFAPSRIRTEPLTKALEMGTTRRSQGRNFLAEQAAEEVAPELKQTFRYLKEGKGDAYGKLFGQASEEYNPESGIGVVPNISKIISEMAATPEITASAMKVIDTAQKRVSMETDDPKKQYNNFKKARTYLREKIAKMSASNDPEISDHESIAKLSEAHDVIDQVMKAIPSQAKADELYKQSMKAKGAFYEAMQFGKGEKRKIDVPTVKKLFGDNDKAYRLREGVDIMRQFLDKFGDDIVPDKLQQMQATVNKFDSLMKQAEDKRLLQGLEQAQGPSSPVVERMSALRQAKGLSGDFFTSPASSLGAADEFMASRAQKMFNNRFEDLGQADKNKLIRMLMWRQQNPDATLTDEESMFKKMMKGK
jgi:hypothetical protein